MNIEEKMIDELIDILSSKKLSEIKYEKKDFKINLKKNIFLDEEFEDKEIFYEEPKKDEFKYIKSGNIGRFFYLDKGENYIINVGQSIKIGQTIGFISTVGIKTPIKSDITGVVEEILLKNGETTDFGKKLIKVK